MGNSKLISKKKNVAEPVIYPFPSTFHVFSIHPGGSPSFWVPKFRGLNVGPKNGSIQATNDLRLNPSPPEVPIANQG